MIGFVVLLVISVSLFLLLLCPCVGDLFQCYTVSKVTFNRDIDFNNDNALVEQFRANNWNFLEKK